MTAEVPVVVDYVLLHCRVCNKQHRIDCDPHLRGAEDVDRFLKTAIARFCRCHVSRCDVRCHLVEYS